MSILDVSGVEKVKKHSKLKAMIAVILIIVVLVGLSIGSFYIYCKSQFSIYGEPIITNAKLEQTNGDAIRTYHDDDGISYAATPGEFPYTKGNLIQTQILTDTELDENMKLITDHTVNVIYRRNLSGDVVYTAEIIELGQPEQIGDIYSQKTTYEIEIDDKCEFISGSGSDCDGKKVKDCYEKYKDEIKQLRDKMYSFFGKDNFKSA